MAKKHRHSHPAVRRYMDKNEGFIERKMSVFLDSLTTDNSGRKRGGYSWEKKMNQRKQEKVINHARLFHIRYGNLMLIIIGIVAGIWMVYNPEALLFLAENESMGLLSAFILGVFYPTGVTTPASIAGFFLLGKTINPFMLAAAGAAGALISDFLIFYFIRHKLVDYLDKFAGKFTKTNMYIWRHRVNNHKTLKHIIPLFAGLLIASPLPTEIAIGIFAAIKFDMKRFLIYAFVFHTFSIYLVSQLGASYHII